MNLQTSKDNENNNNGIKIFIVILIIIIIIILTIFGIYILSSKGPNNQNTEVQTTDKIKFDANVYFLTVEEGGRQTPIFNNYQPQFNFNNKDITGLINLPSNVEKVMPGNKTNITVELMEKINLKVGEEFKIREGGRIIGKGKITKIY